MVTEFFPQHTIFANLFEIPVIVRLITSALDPGLISRYSRGPVHSTYHVIQRSVFFGTDPVEQLSDRFSMFERVRNIFASFIVDNLMMPTLFKSIQSKMSEEYQTHEFQVPKTDLAIIIGAEGLFN